MPYKSQTYVDLENINHTLIHRHNLKEYNYTLNAKEVLQHHSQHYKPANTPITKTLYTYP
ncbi:hypothetical protein [Alkalicoccobacillus murimartini]|uniref:KTSC domain-containing protein n=1 Tax=Alkalicoccobacillus murimartini TaxID=171685 RepID=A0ABT9YEX1_9BACI|nr:hypothetical protein [Alkalicoccobacillus murimartini]MDQ0206086.1 hypothetical protein [Alkalicoccobacillus murimartini]